MSSASPVSSFLVLQTGPEEILGVEGEAMASGGSLASLRSCVLQPSAMSRTAYGKVGIFCDVLCCQADDEEDLV